MWNCTELTRECLGDPAWLSSVYTLYRVYNVVITEYNIMEAGAFTV